MENKYTYGDKVRVSMLKVYEENDMIEETRYGASIDTVITDVILDDGDEPKYKLDYCFWDNEPLIITESMIMEKINVADTALMEDK